MKINLGKIDNDYRVAKEDVELAQNLLINLLAKSKVTHPKQHIELTESKSSDNLMTLSLSKEAFEVLNNFPAEFLQRTFNLENETDIKRIVAILSNQKILAERKKENVETTFQTFEEKRQHDEVLQQNKINDKAKLEDEIISLIEEHRLEFIEDLGLPQGTDIITSQRIISANAKLNGQENILLPGTLSVSFRSQEGADKYLEIFPQRKMIPFISEYIKDDKQYSIECFSISMEYNELFLFPNKKKTFELAELAKLIKQYYAIEIKPDYLFEALDNASESKILGLSELMAAINYCCTTLKDLWQNHKHMAHIIEVCHQCGISEADFLQELIYLHDKRHEFLEINYFLKMLFSFSVQRETIVSICHYFIANNLLKDEIIPNISLDHIPQENRWLFMEIFKEYYKNQSTDIYKKLFNVFNSDEDQAELLELLCRDFEENQLKKLLWEILKNLSDEQTKTALIILKVASKTLKNDEYFVENVLDINQDAFQYASTELQNNKNLILRLSKKRVGFFSGPANALKYASKALKNDKKFIMEVLRNRGSWLEFVAEDLKSDEEVVSEALSNDKSSFLYASEKLTSNEDFILNHCNRYGTIITLASNKLRADKVFIEKLLNKCGTALGDVPSEFRNDPELILIALKNDLEAIYCVSSDLLCNKQFVLSFIAQWQGEHPFKVYPHLQYFKDDHEVILSIAKKVSPTMISQFASKELLHDKEFSMKLLSVNLEYAVFVSQCFNNDPEVALASIRKSSFCLRYISKDLLNDESFIFKAVETNAITLDEMMEQCGNNKKIVKTILSLEPQMLRFASEQLKGDKELLAHALWKMDLLLCSNKQSSSITFFSDSIVQDKASKELCRLLESFLKKEDAQEFLQKTFDISSDIFDELTKSNPSLSFAKQ